MSDLVDKIISQWAEVHPELDTSGLAVVGRVLRLASLIRRGTEDVLAEYELTRPEFDVLCAVRRNGALTPGQITREMLSSGAAVTKRVDRLARMGLLVRERSTRDRRVAHIRLTDQGQNMLDELLPGTSRPRTRCSPSSPTTSAPGSPGCCRPCSPRPKGGSAEPPG
ncbi:MarR family winged helix-turn-helix transcriptional regulator [Prauserella oleivorans]